MNTSINYKILGYVALFIVRVNVFVRMSFSVCMHRSQYAGNVIEVKFLYITHKLPWFVFFLITSNVINTVSGVSMAVSTVALPTPAASSIATETGLGKSTIECVLTFDVHVSLNRCSETVYTFHPEVGRNCTH